MFLCRAARLSAAAAVDQPFRSPGSLLLLLVRVSAHTPGRVTLTTRTGRAFQRHRVSCASAVTGLDPVTHLESPQPDPVLLRWDTRSGSLTVTDRAHLDRVAAVAANLAGLAHREGGGGLDVIARPLLRADRRHSGGRAEPPQPQPPAVAAHVLFTVSSRRGATMTVQTRASSTSAAATKRSDAGEQRDAQTLEKDSTTSSTEKGPEDTEPEGGKPNKTQQLKKVFKEYGAVGVCFHIGISLMSLGMFYLLISSGIDMAAILCKVGFSEAVVQSRMAAGTSTFVLAYAIHKLFAPVRISITLVSVPLIVRYFRKTGLFKPPTPAP